MSAPVSPGELTKEEGEGFVLKDWNGIYDCSLTPSYSHLLSKIATMEGG